MQQKFADRIDVIDIDTRIYEPEDLWTSRVSGYPVVCKRTRTHPSR